MKHPPIILVENITKKYGDFTAINNVSFSVKKGDIFGFIGPNGAGKTTIIRMLTCIMDPDSGTTEIAGLNTIKDALEIKKIINAFPESGGYYKQMTGYDYLKYFSNLYNIERKPKEIYDLLEDVGLSKRANKLIKTYSRGMKQRLGVARALINDPQVLFLDEPTNGLDPEGRYEIHILLKNINKKHGTTIFLSTHILDDVDKLCNRIAIINHGKIVKSGDIDYIKGEANLEESYLKLTEK